MSNGRFLINNWQDRVIAGVLRQWIDRSDYGGLMLVLIKPQFEAFTVSKGRLFQLAIVAGKKNAKKTHNFIGGV